MCKALNNSNSASKALILPLALSNGLWESLAAPALVLLRLVGWLVACLLLGGVVLGLVLVCLFVCLAFDLGLLSLTVFVWV